MDSPLEGELKPRPLGVGLGFYLFGGACCFFYLYKVFPVE